VPGLAAKTGKAPPADGSEVEGWHSHLVRVRCRPNKAQGVKILAKLDGVQNQTCNLLTTTVL